MRSSSHVFALCLATASLAASAAASAQTVAPKQCVTVARDPDEAARAIAVRIEIAFSATPSVRSVADPRTRAILRGEITDDAAQSAIITARRALALADADATALDTIANALGCASITVVASTPRGFAIRRFDALSRQYDASTESAQWTDEALRSRLAIAAAAPITTSTTSASSATSNAATTTPRIAQPTNASTTATSAAQTTAGAPSTNTTAAAAQNANVARTPQRADPRVTTQPDPLRNNSSSRSTPVWAWVIAGVAGAGLIGGFIAAQSIGPSVPLVRVSGPGMAP
ncbi:MAG: hypothetical protein U0269_04160 [Polyangiales bacterium]